MYTLCKRFLVCCSRCICVCVSGLLSLGISFTKNDALRINNFHWLLPCHCRWFHNFIKSTFHFNFCAIQMSIYVHLCTTYSIANYMETAVAIATTHLTLNESSSDPLLLFCAWRAQFILSVFNFFSKLKQNQIKKSTKMESKVGTHKATKILLNKNFSFVRFWRFNLESIHLIWNVWN